VESQPASEKKFTYERHRPEESLLYKIIAENLETFLAQVQREAGHPLPDFVEKEFREYLKCGILAYGFLRLKCEACQNEHFIAFSCKRRGFCPSCCGRRMSETAIHLVDHVFPHKPVRQWVLSFPIPIRLVLAVKPKIMAEVLNITNNAISRFLTGKAGLTRKTGKTGAVTLIQRFGSAVNLNVHFHQLFIDGAYELDEDMRPTRFHATPAPSRREVEDVLKEIVHRTLRLLEKRGILIKDDQNPQLQIADDDTFSKLQAGSAHYRFATGPNKGKKAFTLHAVPDQDHEQLKGLVANISGFSLHAGVAVVGNDRKGLERIARYIARPPIALDRLSVNSKGQVIYRLKKPFSDGSTHIIMQPLELIEKLAALVPRPRIHLTRFHGVLGPHYKFRSLIVSKPQPVTDDQPEKPSIEPQSKGKIAWARLLKRVFDIDMETCNVCGAKMRIVAAIEDPPIIRKILNHLDLPSTPPTIHPARGPPLQFG
jgi:hypothetical protein